MKKITVLILFAALAIASEAIAQVVCTINPNGQTICVPAGGGPSSYR